VLIYSARQMIETDNVLRVVDLKDVFCNVTPCSQVKIYQSFGETDCFHLHVAGSSETSHFNRSARPHIPEDSTLHSKAVGPISRHLFIHSCRQWDAIDSAS
jgi:hypothetical protein